MAHKNNLRTLYAHRRKFKSLLEAPTRSPEAVIIVGAEGGIRTHTGKPRLILSLLKSILRQFSRVILSVFNLDRIGVYEV